jgi:hypothetical protein
MPGGISQELFSFEEEMGGPGDVVVTMEESPLKNIYIEVRHRF